MKLTTHEKTILELIKKHPDIVDNPSSRKLIAQQYGFKEKTLRNRIGDLKKYGVLDDLLLRANPVQSFESNYANDEISMPLLVSIFWNERRLILRNVFIVSLAAIIFSLIMPKTFRSTAVLMHPSSDDQSGILGALSQQMPFGSFIQGGKDESMDFMAILKSRTVMESVIHEFGLIDYYQSDNVERALESLRENVNIEIQEEGTITTSVNVSTGWFHPEEEELNARQMCASMANYFIEQLDAVNKGLKIEKASFQRLFIEKRYRQNIVDLKNAEENFKIFQEDHKMISLPEQTNAAIQAASAIKAQQLASEVQFGVLTKTLNPNHPDVVRLNNEIKELKIKLNEMDYGYNISGQDKLFPIFSEVPELGIQLMRLTREVEIQNTLFTFLTQQYEDAKIQEAKNTPTVQVLDKGKIPELKYKPARARIVIIGFTFSLVISMYYLHFLNRWKKITAN